MLQELHLPRILPVLPFAGSRSQNHSRTDEVLHIPYFRSGCRNVLHHFFAAAVWYIPFLLQYQALFFVKFRLYREHC